MWAFRVAVLVGGCVAAACGEASPRTVTETTQPTVAATATAAAASPTVVHRRARHLRHGWGFDSPTGNIRCAIFTNNHAELGCKTLNNGRGVILRATGSGYRDDQQTGPTNPTLPYGWRWTSRDFECWSKFTEVLCRSFYSRYGFSINRDGIQGWVWPRALRGSAPAGGGGGGGGSVPPATIPGGTGSLVRCNDGTWSNSGGIQGACSSHGGEAG